MIDGLSPIDKAKYFNAVFGDKSGLPEGKHSDDHGAGFIIAPVTGFVTLNNFQSFTFDVQIIRMGCTDALTLNLHQAPAGLSIVNNTIPGDATVFTIEVQIAETFDGFEQLFFQGLRFAASGCGKQRLFGINLFPILPSIGMSFQDNPIALEDTDTTLNAALQYYQDNCNDNIALTFSVESVVGTGEFTNFSPLVIDGSTHPVMVTADVSGITSGDEYILRVTGTACNVETETQVTITVN